MLSAPSVAIIGARKATPYGLECAKILSELAVARDVVVVSGGARGCDCEAHEETLRVEGKTVAVLAGGLDSPYPQEHIPLFQRIIDRGGAVITEQAWDAEPLTHMFRERNRIIAALAHATVVVEAGIPSGTFATTEVAQDLGRVVAALPGRITDTTSAGTNRLIANGATPVVDAVSFEALLQTLKED